ncbi:hypothetical protein JCM16814_02930 [Desulfobaculum senezii]|jgi:hypothetical protein
MAHDERAELEALSHEELLDCFEGALFEHVTEGKEFPEMVEMTIALGIRNFVATRLAPQQDADIIDLFLDGDRAVVELVDHAAELGLLE